MPGVTLQKKNLTLEEILHVCQGKSVSFGNVAINEEVTNVVIDSRDAKEGSLFCAIPGEKVDGFSYIPSAVKNGCRVVLCQKEPSFEEELNYVAVVVEDTVAAMGRLARYYRSLFQVVVVGVTGSVGKTTTKEMIAEVCKRKYKTHKTEGNYNSVIGMPLTLFSMPKDTEVAVLEMGMSQFGEIERMSRICEPDIGVITCIGTAHIEYLGSREGICKAKMEITAGMKAGKSRLLLLGDEPLLRKEAGHELQPLYFSPEYSEKETFVYAKDVESLPQGQSFTAVIDGSVMEKVVLSIKGSHNISDATAAIAVGTLLHVPEEGIRDALANYLPVGMRQKIVEVRHLTVIEDCYNANPESMKASLQMLCEEAEERKLPSSALLGDMLELGENTTEYHRNIGKKAAQSNLKYLFCFGPLAQYIAQGAREEGMSSEKIIVISDISAPGEMAQQIQSRLTSPHLLLVKASRGIAAERVVEELQK